jgi:hypothetical protein
MYYQTAEANPTAQITKQKSRLKVYKNNVYLNDNDNFEIELYNPTSKSILCKIKLNGEYISNSGIVLRPAERVFLDRFINENSKFLFSTYNVSDTKKNRSIIEHNGAVEVDFFRESQISTSTGTYWLTNNISTPTITPYNYYTTTSNQSPSFIGSTLTSSVSSSNNVNLRGNILTGRVQKGEKSTQNFTNTHQNFDFFSFHTIKYKILPKENKPIESHEIRSYCTNCGTKMKKGYKFCPTCGEKQ